MKLFLSDAELSELTERSSIRYQIAWLDENEYPFERSALGRPRVLRAYVERRLGFKIPPLSVRTEPDFSAWQ